MAQENGVQLCLNMAQNARVEHVQQIVKLSF